MRVPEVKREDLSPTDQGYYDEIVESRGGIRGPFPALLHSPQLASLVAATGHYARFDCVLPNPLREVAIICAAKENQEPVRIHSPCPLGAAGRCVGEHHRRSEEGRHAGRNTRRRCHGDALRP